MRNPKYVAPLRDGVPIWADVYSGVAHVPDRDQDMIPVTRETLRIAMKIMERPTDADYDFIGATAYFELREAVK